MGESFFGACCIWTLLAYVGCPCLVHMGLRTKIRERYGVRNGCNDMLVTWCCASCAMCQEARQLQMPEPTTPSAVAVTKK